MTTTTMGEWVILKRFKNIIKKKFNYIRKIVILFSYACSGRIRRQITAIFQTCILDRSRYAYAKFQLPIVSFATMKIHKIYPVSIDLVF